MILIRICAASLRRSSSAMMIFLDYVWGVARQSSSAMMIFLFYKREKANGTDYTTATGACQGFS